MVSGEHQIRLINFDNVATLTAPWANGSGAVKEHLLEAAKYRANKLNNEKNEVSDKTM